MTIAPLQAQDLKTDDFHFVPYPYKNPRKITGYYEVPAQLVRPAGDGIELQLSVDALGRYQPSVSNVNAAQQVNALGTNGHLTPTKIIIGMPPYPELEAGTVSSLSATAAIKVSAATSTISSNATPADTYQRLFNGQSFTMTNYGSTGTIYGNAIYPYNANNPYGAENNIYKPSGTNHQWLSMDFTTSNFTSAGTHIAVILYRWRQIYATSDPPPHPQLIQDIYPLVGAGAIAGNNAASTAGCGYSGTPHNAGSSAPIYNAQTELFGRRVYLASYDPYSLVSPPFVPNQDPYGPVATANNEIPASANPANPASNVWSPSCSLAGLSDGTNYRLIVHASDGGWASYFFYKNVGGSWQLLASPSGGASPNGTSYQIAPTSYTTPASTYQYDPLGYPYYYAFRASPTSTYGTFNANMGGFAIVGVGSAVSWSINFTNVQFGACLEGSNCNY